MPIEVKELHIKVQVTSGEESTSGGGNTGGNDASGQDAIIAACVEKVLEILKYKQER